MSQPPIRLVGSLDDHRGGHVTENEMAVAVAEVEVARADLGVDHQRRIAPTPPRCNPPPS